MPTRAVRLLVAGGIAALSLVPAAWAPDGVADVSASVSFDRGRVARGQIAVAEISLANLGPNRAVGVVVEARVRGGRPLRARATPGSCAKPRGQTVRCAFRILGFGSGPRAELQLKADPAARSLRVDAVIAMRRTRDPSPGNDEARATLPVAGRAPAPGYAEISFVLAAPTTVEVGETFTARLTLLNRGPSPAEIGRISLSPRPDARVALSTLPRRLAVGEQRIVRARITPTRIGPLTLHVRVGANGTALAAITVTPAPQ